MSVITRVGVLALLLGLPLSCGARAEDLDSADRLFKAGKWGPAREAYENALPALKGNDAARVLRQIGYTWQIQHRHEQALPYFEKSIEISKQKKMENDLALAYSGMGSFHKQQGNTEQAREYLTKALEIFERLGTLIEPDKVREELGELAEAG